MRQFVLASQRGIMPSLRQRPHHARAHVQAGIRGGKHGREHHEIHDVAGDTACRSTVEHEHERACRRRPTWRHGISAHITAIEPMKNIARRNTRGVHGLRNRLGSGSLRLAGGRRRRPRCRRTRTPTVSSVAKHSACTPLGKPCRPYTRLLEHRSMLVAGNRNRAEHGEQADDDERADSEHLDGGEPEFRFAVQSRTDRMFEQ